MHSNMYKQKYLKYKTKYTNLKNEMITSYDDENKNHFNLIGGDITDNFKVIPNNGSNGEITSTLPHVLYSNQCMWLSIIDYARIKLNRVYTLNDIRRIASKNDTLINGPNEEFDSDIHSGAMINVCSELRLNVKIFNVMRFAHQTTQSVLSKPKFDKDEPGLIYGDEFSPNKVYIISYGRHFALITQINGIDLYGINSVNKTVLSNFVQSDFVPSIELAIGNSDISNFNHTKNSKNLKEEEKQLDTLANTRINLQLKLDELKKSKTNIAKRLARIMEELNDFDKLYEAIKKQEDKDDFMEIIQSEKRELLNDLRKKNLDAVRTKKYINFIDDEINSLLSK